MREVAPVDAIIPVLRSSPVIALALMRMAFVKAHRRLSRWLTGGICCVISVTLRRPSLTGTVPQPAALPSMLECQIARNCVPHFARNRDPSSA